MDTRFFVVGAGLISLLVPLLGCPGDQGGGQAGQPGAGQPGAGQPDAGQAGPPDAGQPAEPAQSAAPSGKPWDPTLGTATIRGAVKLTGEPPRMRPIDMAGADEKCAELHGGERVKPETVVVNDNGTLRNAFVWVKTGLEGFSFPMPEGDALLDQRGCIYHPHVQGMRKGQSLAIKTSDPTAHNVHGYAKVNRPFNRSQPAGAADVSVRMLRDEVSPPMKVKCDIHPWMNAFVAVVDHPYFAVTGPDGSFELGKLPPGTYTIQAWHENYDVIEQTVTIGGDETKTLDFNYSG